MARVPLPAFAALSCLASWIIGGYLPGVRLLPFAGAIALFLPTESPRKTVLLAIACGMGLDLLITDTPLGLFALSSLVATLLLLRYRTRFSNEEAVPLFLLTSLFSALVTFVALLLHQLLDKKIGLTYDVLLSELLFAPLCDGVASLLGIYLPLALFLQAKRLWRRWRRSID